ncbi:MAG: TetR/AcrR family transcriptional regulator [Microthrixaceae bacterium]|nr:TetR/AcrR family transcriptional regulator [Microthrixaceae bacterium]
MSTDEPTVARAPVDEAVEAPGADGSPRARRPLSLERIVSAAIDLIESEGPDALSMRRLAARLGSSTMATYHHVADRQALMEAIGAHLMAELDPDASPAATDGTPAVAGRIPPGGAPWTELVRTEVTAFLELSRRHPATFAALLRTRPTALVVRVEAIAVDLMAAGLGEADARLVVRTTARYLMGSVMGEEAAVAAGQTLDEMNESFEFGLGALLEGMSGRLG